MICPRCHKDKPEFQFQSLCGNKSKQYRSCHHCRGFKSRDRAKRYSPEQLADDILKSLNLKPEEY